MNRNIDLENYEPVENSNASQVPNIEEEDQPKMNRMIRCPLPYTTPSPDALRQFYMGERVPQYRLITK